MKRAWLVFPFVLLAVGLMDACASQADTGKDLTRGREATFKNTETDYRVHLGNVLKILRDYISAERAAPVPAEPIPLRMITAQELVSGDSGDRAYRLGHSTVLLRLDGEYVLTDPMFSERASPVQWLGPRRFHPPPIDPQALPPIKAVVISHDHYDHLDKASVLALDSRVEQFVTPLKVGAHLRRWGIAADKIVELDWWQSVRLGNLELTATPAQHFSGRGLGDRNQTLWAGWVIAGRETRVFFSGDSGYFGGFREIGTRLGPFDLTLMEAGAYNPMWAEMHLLPEQSVQAHRDLGGRAMLPVHNSTFDLALHDWYDPLERTTAEAERRSVRLLTPIIGAPVQIADPAPTPAWWRQQMVSVRAPLAPGR